LDTNEIKMKISFEENRLTLNTERERITPPRESFGAVLGS